MLGDEDITDLVLSHILNCIRLVAISRVDGQTHAPIRSLAYQWALLKLRHAYFVAKLKQPPPVIELAPQSFKHEGQFVSEGVTIEGKHAEVGLSRNSDATDGIGAIVNKRCCSKVVADREHAYVYVKAVLHLRCARDTFTHDEEGQLRPFALSRNNSATRICTS